MRNVLKYSATSPNGLPLTGSVPGAVVSNFVPGSGSFTTAPLAIEHVKSLGFQMTLSGTLVGGIDVQVSNDPDWPIGSLQSTAKGPGPFNWNSLPNSSASIAAPSAYYFSFNDRDAPAQWARLRFMPTAGAGSWFISAVGKGE
jgi:hypothetical protein